MKETAISVLTVNPGKVKEIRGALGPLGLKVESMDIGFVEVQADSLEEVVSHGFEELLTRCRLERPAMKDDSGLFINVLNGFPGVYSSYVQRTLTNKGLLRLMKDEEDRNASFRTVIGLYIPEEGLNLFRGECQGTISTEEQGVQGFGYDPIFVPRGHTRTFAEMTSEEKNAISHRGKAVAQMMSYLERRL